jgi:hypothetical protein
MDEEDTSRMMTVTPKMARAGAALLAERYDQIGDGIDEEIAAEVFRRMIACAWPARAETPRVASAIS